MENWKWIPGFENQYQASDLGRIKSFKVNKQFGQIMQGNILKDGRKRVNLNGKKYLVHRLILLTFDPDGYTTEKCLAMHLDGDPSNNKLNNLQWGSYSDNAQDEIKKVRIKITKEKNKNFLENQQNLYIDGEIWKDIENYEGLYQISNFGRVKSFHNPNKPLIMSQSLGRTQDYYSITLTKKHQKNRQSFSVDKLVAQAFVENPNNYSEINHIDENTKNNKADNLEWVTHSQNIQHSIYRQSYPVIQYTKNGIEVNRFPSLAEAQRQTGIPRTNISSSIKRNGTAGGFVWKFVK